MAMLGPKALRGHLGAGGLLGAAVVVLGLDLGQVLELGLLVEEQAAHLGQMVPPRARPPPRSAPASSMALVSGRVTHLRHFFMGGALTYASWPSGPASLRLLPRSAACSAP